MSYLIDTCVLSELRKPAPRESVLAWFQACNEEDLFISSLSLGELYFGISILPEGKRKNDLLFWFNELVEAFMERIIPVTESTAIVWGNLRAKAQKGGCILPVIDGLLAATTDEHRMVLVTRNTDDVLATGIPFFNPWLQA